MSITHRAYLRGRARRLFLQYALPWSTSLLVGLVAVVSGNNLVFLIVAAMMATMLISGLVSRLCLAGLQLDFIVPEHVPAGRAVPGKLFVRNQKWFMPSFSIRVEAMRGPGSPALRSGVA